MDMIEQVDEMIDVAEYMIPPTAKIIRLLFNELVKQGFSEEHAIKICTNYQMNK